MNPETLGLVVSCIAIVISLVTIYFCYKTNQMNKELDKIRQKLREENLK